MTFVTENMNGKEWEAFCEIVLRKHYGQPNFWIVPDQDRGDLGIEFFTADGTIFQCYYPDLEVDLATYKKKIQKKINDDLKKLKVNEKSISKLIGEIEIKQWVLLIQELKSKDLISYCDKKRRETISKAISYIDSKKFQVKIETADSFPDAKLYALNVHLKLIDIPLATVSDQDKENWKDGNVEFYGNIERKSQTILGDDSANFESKVVTKYIQIDKFLDQLREDHPDLFTQIEDSAWAQLEAMQEDSLFEDCINRDFIKQIVNNNREAFEKYSKYFSDTNKQSLAFGYLSKWIAECYMDFQDV